MDAVTLALAKKSVDELKKSGGAGYVNYEGVIISFKGDITGKETFEGEPFGLSGTYVLVSDYVLRGTHLENVRLQMSGNSFPAKNPIVSSGDAWVLMVENSIATDDGMETDVTVALSFPPEFAQLLGVSPGTYFWFKDGYYPAYLRYLSGDLLETTHTIDPKFLPDTVATKADIIGAMEASY